MSGQSESRSNGDERTIYIPQIFSIEALPSIGLVLYSGHSLVWESYISEEMQSVWNTARANWAYINSMNRIKLQRY